MKTTDIWCRCNKCGELFVAPDGTNFADLRCPACRSNESISVRSTEKP